MSDLRKAATLALEALEFNCITSEDGEDLTPAKIKKAITALRQALASEALDKMAENAREIGLDYEPAQQEPVAGQPLPCPFCGHIGLDFADGETYRWGVASCGGCGASCGDVRREYPDKGEWHSEAIAEWNRRYTRPQSMTPLTDERLELIGHADLGINNIYIFNGYGEEVPEGRTPIYAGYKADIGIKENK